MSDYENNTSSDEEESATSFIKGRDAFIYVIDAFMFTNQGHFHEALTLIREAFLTGIISHPKQLIGIVFHNTKNSPLPVDLTGMDDIVVLKNQAVFLPLRSLSKDVVSYYKDFCSNNYFDFETKFGMEEGNFANTMRLCCSMFHTCRPRPGSETIVYFTNKESPHSRNSDEINKAILKANDLRDLNIDFEVLPMSEDFNYNSFYKEFLCLVKGTDIDSFEIEDTETRKDMFKAHQLALNLKGRCVSHFKWKLGNGLDLSVGYYSLFSKSCMPKSVKLLRSDNSQIDVKRVKELKYLDELGESSETRLLLPGEEKHVLKSPGDFIVVDADEVDKLKTPIPTSLQLCGFIEKQNIAPFDLFIKSSGFIYPSEFDVVGSTKLFRAIWQKCIDMNKLALCVLVKKRKSYPSFVVLEPTQSGFDGTLKRHDGFCVHYLPSFDNIRNIDIRAWETEQPSNEQIGFFKQVVKKLRVNYDPLSKSLADPALDEINAKIIALAFDLETEISESGLDPSVDEQDERMNFTKEEMVQLFGEEDVLATKRCGTTSTNGNAAKKAKITDGEINENMIIEMVNRDALGALSVNQMKLYLSQKGETGLSKLTKGLLIDKIKNLHS